MMDEVNEKKNSKLSWKDFLPIILAIPIAIMIKIFIFTTYHVPTASMIPTIIPGDHILVEKWVFGPRVFIQGKIIRLPGWHTIKRGEILVFNVPKEDSIFRKNRDINYYNWKHSQASSSSIVTEMDSFQFMPIPGRTPFVKRVIGLPGDELKFTGHTLLLNGHLIPTYPNGYQQYEIVFKETNEFDRYKDTLYRLGEHIQMNRSDLILTGIFKNEDLSFIDSQVATMTAQYYFPLPSQIPKDFSWARALAEYGHPIKIPYKGWTTKVDSLFIQQYGQIIRRFDGFKGEIKGNQIININEDPIVNYTFKQNYYWAMGDNRPYSVDSRAWGLIPEDHIIGITRRTFWSKVPEIGFKEGFRWERLWKRLQ